MLLTMLKGILGIILILAYVLITLFMFYVLRVALYWFWDIDYLRFVKKYGKESNESHRNDAEEK